MKREKHLGQVPEISPAFKHLVTEEGESSKNVCERLLDKQEKPGESGVLEDKERMHSRREFRVILRASEMIDHEH